MGRRVDKIEPYISGYQLERSAYRLDDDNHIVHLRLLSPDNSKTHVEYYSYIIPRGIQVLTTKIENGIIKNMEHKMNIALGRTWALQKSKINNLKNQMELLSDAQQQLMEMQLKIRCKINSL